MKPILPHNLEAALLFDSFSPLEPKQLNSLLNQIVAEHDLHFKWIPSEDNSTIFQFICDECGVRVVQTDTQVDRANFDNTLASGYTRMTFPLAGEAVRNHRSHVMISVGRGVIDKTGEQHVGGLAGGKQPLDREEFDFVVNLLKSLVMIYMSGSRPMGVYWKQSDRLLSLRQFAELALEPRDVSLLVHPCLESFDSGPEDEKLQALRTIGAVNLIGHEIEFEKSATEPEHLVERVMQFILNVRETGALIPDGDSFGIDENETIRVHHPADGSGEAIRLVFEQKTFAASVPEVADAAVDETEETTEIDPEDPAERALQERIEELKGKAGSGSGDDGGADSETDEESKPAPEPWQGVKKRADMSALRALTPRDISDNASPSAEPVDTSTLGDTEVGTQDLQEDAPALSPEFNDADPVSESIVDDVEETPSQKPASLIGRVTGLLKR